MNKSDFYYEENLERKLKVLQQENQQLKEQLKQREEVIDEIRRFIQDIIDNPVNNADKNNVCGIYEILQKYRKADKSK